MAGKAKQPGATDRLLPHCALTRQLSRQQWESTRARSSQPTFLAALLADRAAKAATVFEGMTSQVAGWQPERFNMDFQFMQDVEGAVRATVARGFEKVHDIGRVPCLVARIIVGSSIATRVLAQWEWGRQLNNTIG